MSKIALILLSPLLLAACQSGMHFATESPSGELVEQPVLPLAPAAESEPLGSAELEVSPGPRGEGGDALDVRVSMARFAPESCELSLAAVELRDDAGRVVPAAYPEGAEAGPLLAVGETGQGEAAFRFILEPGALDAVEWVLVDLHWWVSGEEVHDEIRFEKVVRSSGSPGWWSFAFSFASFSSDWGGSCGGGHGHHHSRRSPDPRRGSSSTPATQSRRSSARGGGGKRSRR